MMDERTIVSVSFRQCVEAAGFKVLSTAVQSTLALLPYGICIELVMHLLPAV